MDAAPIYSHPITSIAEVGPILERYPDTSSSVRTTEQIHSLRYEDLESSLRIDQQFKTAFCGTLGFDVHEQVEASSHTYLQVVNSCLEECNLFSDLTITAIQCHQSAFKYFIE